MFPRLLCIVLLLDLSAAAVLPESNLLLNPTLDFHCIENSRTGSSGEFKSGAVPCWNQTSYGNVEAVRATRQSVFRTSFPVANVAVIHPGKSLHQFSLLCEMGVDGGEQVSLSVYGHQKQPDSLHASVQMMGLDSDTGIWSPKDFGGTDARSFPKHSRGELVAAAVFESGSGPDTDFELKVEKAIVPFGFNESATASTKQPNVIGITVEFTNKGKEDVWIYSPSLVSGSKALNRLPQARATPEHYRSIPRTMQKLWRGEPLHIIVMGSSIDRGSANPKLVPYDENRLSPTFKEPLSESTDFDGALLGHPEWTDYTGWWQHHYMYGGRLRRLLMEKFNYPIDRLLLNTMAADGSCISESHSGLQAYASLSLPPDRGTNGHPKGKTWQELYPAVFARPEGARPDLVIFGSGANEKVDGGQEVAAFEGAIRWFQRNYPDIEFVFCMWQNRESYTPNTGHLRELSLRYQIPFLDLGRVLSETTRHCNSYALVPQDGHPQAAAHYLWAKQLERAFDALDPIKPGLAQLQQPERLSNYTIGWEGDITSYGAGDKRIRNRSGFILDDTFINLWASSKDEFVPIRMDGAPASGSRRKPSPKRDPRNSTFATGLLGLGDRHIVEVGGLESALVAADSKMTINRQLHSVASPRWKVTGTPEAFISDWGAPYGDRVLALSPGSPATIDFVGTDLSIAYADVPDGGNLIVLIDGIEQLKTPTNEPFIDMAGTSLFMENRKGIRGLPYGWHSVEVRAEGKPVRLLGAFTYDTRANRTAERVLRGNAFAGESLSFSAHFKTRPWVICHGSLALTPEDTTATGLKFSGTGGGFYEIVGE